jgi:endonuclease/exonuclease/phosphatase family protein
VSQLKINNVQFELFKTNVPDLNLAGIPVHFGRGWIAVDAQLRGKPFRFVTTHLESLSDLVQAGQTFELIDGPLSTTLPVILAGDLNSGPTAPPPLVSPVGPAFGILLGAGGFTDTWGFLHSSEPGFTWPLFLEDPVRASDASQRIDNILIRGDGIEPFSEILTGTSPFIPGLWASDHAGAVATVKLLPKQ